MTTTDKPGKKKVQVRHHKSLATTVDMKQWPNGQELLEALSKERLQPKQQGDAAFWQATIRWSMLKKYGLCPETLQDPYYLGAKNDGTPYKTLRFSSQDTETIAQLWQDRCELASNETDDDNDNDLTQFLKTATSNGRPLRWSFLDCGPACQFKLHAHPNLEVIYCVAGALHEIRMEGLPVTKSFEKDVSAMNHLEGPDLSAVGRPWKFETLVEGGLLVNEVGSIHRSFCATNGEGSLLFVLWGGSHADVTPDHEPKSVSIQKAMDTMDQKLCDCGSSWETISETFLPESDSSLFVQHIPEQ